MIDFISNNWLVITAIFTVIYVVLLIIEKKRSDK